MEGLIDKVNATPTGKWLAFSYVRKNGNRTYLLSLFS